MGVCPWSPAAMGVLQSVPFCSRSRDDNNNLPDRPDLNLNNVENNVVVDTQPEATSTPKAGRVPGEEDDQKPIVVQPEPGQLLPHQILPDLRTNLHPPDITNSLEGDSGLEHSCDEVDLPSDSDNILDNENYDDEVDSVGASSDHDEEIDLKEEEEEEQPKKEVKKEVVKQEANIIEDKIDLKQLEDEILGDQLVEPAADNDDEENVSDVDEEQDIADSTRLGGKKQDTSNMITDMLNQMVVDGSRDVAIR